VSDTHKLILFVGEFFFKHRFGRIQRALLSVQTSKHYLCSLKKYVSVDIFDKNKRSEVMSKIRSRDTKPERTLRKLLFARGFRYRVNVPNLPGKPDIVLPKYKTVIFLHGCFWHNHEGCKYAYIPKTNTKFWIDKITSNAERDKVNAEKLTALGWNIVTVWECEIRHINKRNLMPLIDRVEAEILAQVPQKVSMKFYEERENEILMVAEDVVEYQRTAKNNLFFR
jgi:DNA mismatch endonuclease (patch repair protein)